MDRIAQLAEKKAIGKIRAFVESAWFILAFGAVMALFYVLNLPLVTLGLVAISGIFVFLFCEDTRPSVCIAFLTLISLRYKDNAKAYISAGAIVLYAILIPLVIGAAVYRLVKHRVPFKSKYGLLGITLFSVAFLLGGMFSKYNDLYNFFYAVGMVACLMGSYLFFAYTVKDKEDNFIYIAKIFAVAICLIALELVELYARKYTWGTPLDALWKGKITLGWSISNMVAEMIVFGLPAVFYLIYKEDRGYLYWIVVAVGVLAVYFTFGRNALLWGGIVCVVGSLMNCFVGKNKKIHRIVLLGVVGAALCIFIVFCATGYIQKIARFFLDVRFSDRERFLVWERHFGLFLEYPIFGSGFSAYHNYLGYWQHLAHNIWLQMLASTGIVGFSLFMFHHVWSFTLIGKKPSWDRVFIYSCIIVGIGMSLLSPLFFGPYFLIPYAVLILLLEKSKPKKEGLPLGQE